ncbi:thiol-disulfide oxidoreductase DCC family protein [Bacillus safensis]|uniref:thiol-disulfide oxidoreductase DCC family protein n=1 Tax=Bacillus safensis TaxID=561879 RepID=UPI001F285EA9|nr:thiol-disulfide oxidoreductase DCC family protein [Bacillus safensis]UIN49465.1 thiol-disulfide oxidoreductase DCC family protein [Bacillus safensis]WAT79987.1 thiol-disulfide oxidoreductase DCC family protein [Bacillus safensis]
MHSTHPPHLILFDGVCNVCSGAVQFVIKRDPNERMMFASLQSDTGQRILKENGLPLDEFNSFIYIEKGTLYTKSTGILKAARHLKGIYRWSFLLLSIPRPIRDWFYQLIAKNRYKWFGQKTSCMMPTPDIQKRFLS